MTLNGIPIKKYKAKVRNNIPMTTSTEKVNTDEYKIVEGYVSIQSIVMKYDTDLKKQPIKQYNCVFVSEEIDFSKIAGSGFGISVFSPIIYDEFEIIGEVEE